MNYKGNFKWLFSLYFLLYNLINILEEGVTTCRIGLDHGCFVLFCLYSLFNMGKTHVRWLEIFVVGAKVWIFILGLKPYLLMRCIREGANDWGGPRINSRVRKEWRAEVRGGHPPRTERISVEQVSRWLG